jgi:hypothetical protein
MEGKEITVCLTSCGRFDLLEKTIQSLVEFWDGPAPKGFFINEDSGLMLPFAISEFIELVWPDCRYVESYGKKNQILAIDTLYGLVETPYIFQMEDDWTFHRSGFIQKSLDILEENEKIMQVWIREPNDRNGHPATGGIRKCKTGTRFQMLAGNYRGQWSGFAFNPGLRRLSDYKRIGPYSDLATFDPKNPLKAEMTVGRAYGKHGFRACTLLEGYCTHSGNNRHVSA